MISTMIGAVLTASLMQPTLPATREERLFEAIAAQIGDRRLVALGEASHGDGSTFAFKVRLIDYLVRHHGYDVLAFESGFWSLAEAQDAVDGGAAASSELRSAIFPLWARAEQFAPLYDLLDTLQAEGQAPTLAGFDFQPTGADKTKVVETLRTLASQIGPEGEAVGRLADAMADLVERKSEAFSDLDLDALGRDRRDAVAALERSGHARAPIDIRLVDSVGRFLRFAKLLSGGPQDVSGDELNVRDEVMAANMEALALGPLRDRKIILWGATSHFLKDRTAIDVQSDAGMIPMGAHLASSTLADDYYVLGFSALSGQVGSMRSGSFDLPVADDDTIEARLLAANPEADVAFVSLPCGGERQKVRALGHAQWTGDWGCAIDGLIVFREMEPTRYPAP